METTMKALIASHVGDRLAIGAPGRDGLSYDGLRSLTADVTASLSSLIAAMSSGVAICPFGVMILSEVACCVS